MKLDGHEDFAIIRMMATILILLAMLHTFTCAPIEDNDDYDLDDSFIEEILNEGIACETKDGKSDSYEQSGDGELYIDIYIHRIPKKTMKHKSTVHKISPKKRSPLPIPMIGPENNERPSQAACREWKSLDIAVHILGGSPVKPGVFGHMGALIQNDQSGGRPMFVVQCGGSLINERHVLTAAHCVSDPYVLPTLVRLGAVIWDSEKSNPVDVGIEDIMIHNEYRAPIKYHDIAIIRLVRDVEFSPYVRPACLYSDTADVDPSKQLTVIGWGSTNPMTRAYSNSLLMTNVTTVPLSACNQTHLEKGVSRKYKKGLDSGQYCAFDKKMENDACEGDSGGPLQLVEKKETKIVGIVSFGEVCGTALPAVYTRVASYLDWIESIVWPNVADIRK